MISRLSSFNVFLESLVLGKHVLIVLDFYLYLALVVVLLLPMQMKAALFPVVAVVVFYVHLNGVRYRLPVSYATISL